MFKNLVTLVTGSASGLGKETAKYISELGGKVVACDLATSNGQEVAEAFQNTVYANCDVASESDVVATLKLCQEKFGRLDVVVNCAGKSAAFSIANPRSKNYISDYDYENIMSSNLYGTFNVTRLAVQMMYKNVPVLTDDQKGVIINVGASYAEDGINCQSLIAAAKAAVAAMTLPLAREFAPLGVRVVTIAPGLFETPILSEECISLASRVYLMQQMQSLNRFGHPSEFAQLVGEVITNPMLNGEIIRINSGLRAHGNYPFIDPNFVPQKRPELPKQFKK